MTTNITSAKYYTRNANGFYVEYCVEVGKGWSAPTLSNGTTATIHMADNNNYYWKKNAVIMSQIASWLCVVDCTLLPIMTTLFPLLGVATSSLPNQEWVHDLGHSLALFFVLPVGLINALIAFPTDTLFYYVSIIIGTVDKNTPYTKNGSSAANTTQELSLFTMTFFGLSFVYAANAEHDMPLISTLPHHIAHDLHCGTLLHKTVNLCGCALMLVSNYLSYRYNKNKRNKLHPSSFGNHSKNNNNESEPSRRRRKRLWQHTHSASCGYYYLRIFKEKEKST